MILIGNARDIIDENELQFFDFSSSDEDNEMQEVRTI